jgi:hypothetical protein
MVLRKEDIPIAHKRARSQFKLELLKLTEKFQSPDEPITLSYEEKMLVLTEMLNSYFERKTP